MEDILKFKIIKYKLIIFLSFSILYVNSQFEDITLDNGHYSKSFNEKKEMSKFKVTKINDKDYLKIKIEGNGQNQNTNHIISYYDDNKLNERKQLSQSLTNMTIMWLSKEQIQKDFYLTIECAKTPCDYNLELNSSNTAEIYLNEQYTYYITKENAEMKFSMLLIKENYNLDDEGDNQYSDYYVSIWARGNKQIKTKIEGGAFTNLSKFNYYRIPFVDFYENKLDLVINGEKGDLINIGLLLIKKEDERSFISQIMLENGVEVTGYLMPDQEQNFITREDPSDSYGYFYDFNNKLNEKISAGTYYGLETNIDDDSFYSIQYLSDTKYKGEGNNIYSPLLNGIYYYKMIEEGTNIGLIPMKPEDDFNYLTYEVHPYFGEINVSILKCDNYPLCHLDNENIKKAEEIKDYKSYFYTYNKAEWPKDISPISKNQNMLLINCKKGLGNTCISNINMKTDNKIINITDFNTFYPSYQRFIRKNNKDKYFFKGKDKPIYLYIETFSGKINVIISPNITFLNPYEEDNRKLYIFGAETDLAFTIEASENSVYLIHNYNDKEFQIGSNYLLNIENDKELVLQPKDEEFDKDDYNYYIGIYRLNCTVDFKILRSQLLIKKELNEELPFFQDIVTTSLEIELTFTNSEKNSESCPVFVSIYKLEKLDSYTTGIPLGFNSSHKFLIQSLDDYSMLFSLPHTEKEKDINIDFKLIDKAEYNLTFILNNETLKKENINSNKTIQLKSDDIKKKCKDSQFICKIILYVEMVNKKQDCALEITPNCVNKEKINPNPSPSDNTTDKPSSNNKMLTIIIISCVAFLLIIILVVIFILIYKFKKNKDLSDEVNKISFQDNNKAEDDENGDTLLE